MDRLNEAWEIVVEVTYRSPTDMARIENIFANSALTYKEQAVQLFIKLVEILQNAPINSRSSKQAAQKLFETFAQVITVISY
jgi:hypothetical protein